MRVWRVRALMLAVTMLSGTVMAGPDETPAPTSGPTTGPVTGSTSATTAPPTDAAEADCPAPRPGTLTVQTTPWTMVAVDDVLVGTTPLFRFELAAGPHRLRFLNDARGVDVVEEVVIEEGRAHKLKLLLVADEGETLLSGQQDGAELECIEDDDAGFVSIQTRPWSKVWIDGRLVGVTPLFQQKVRAGLHALRFKGPEGQLLSTRVQVGRGEVVKVALPLTDPAAAGDDGLIPR